MTDDLDRRLKGLADDIEPAVVIAPAAATREHGRRHRTRKRAAGVVAAAAAVAAIATGFVALSDTGGEDKAPLAASPSPSPTSRPLECPASPPPNAKPGELVFIPRDNKGERVDAWCYTTESPGTRGPVSPRALVPSDLPAVPGAPWHGIEGETGTWTGRAADLQIAPGTCVANVWERRGPDFEGRSLDLAPETQVALTSYSSDVGTEAAGSRGIFHETLVTLPDAQSAQALVAKMAGNLATCTTDGPATPVGGSDTAQLWRTGNGGFYSGFVGFGVSGKTVAVLWYVHTTDGPSPAFTPELVQTALTKAASS